MHSLIIMMIAGAPLPAAAARVAVDAAAAAWKRQLTRCATVILALTAKFRQLIGMNVLIRIPPTPPPPPPCPRVDDISLVAVDIDFLRPDPLQPSDHVPDARASGVFFAF